jgi:hypothetical protein
MGRWGPSLRVKQTEHESNHELKNLPFVNNALMTLKVAIGDARHSRQPTCFIVNGISNRTMYTDIILGIFPQLYAKQNNFVINVKTFKAQWFLCVLRT